MEATEFRAGAALAATEGTAALTDREKHLVGLAVTNAFGRSTYEG